MSARTALITGAAGQDGTLLAEWLGSLGYRLVGVVREPTLGERPPSAAIEWVTIDLTDSSAVRALLERCQPDEIYHLAAHHHSSQQNAAAPETKQRVLETNFMATQTLAFALLASGAKSSLVFAASSQMYTATASTTRVSELTPRQPATFYGHVKSWSTELLAQLRTELGLRASTAILFNHESPVRGTQFVSRKIAQAAAAIRCGRPRALEIANTRARVDWGSAADTVRALHLMATAERPHDYVVASGSLHSVQELLEVAFGYCGLEWREHTRVAAERETPALCGDPTLIETTLGWRRTVSFEQMIQQMVEHDLRSLTETAS
jgi:GDPmannose 4,6-dehydratase